mmetsp:Transcript_22813/g.77687  ORF Transcript_22813/g.77687 Transcript_22813/m.77687 type:complete len:237 (-) Transcript_22813:1391-2101(-)
MSRFSKARTSPGSAERRPIGKPESEGTVRRAKTGAAASARKQSSIVTSSRSAAAALFLEGKPANKFARLWSRLPPTFTCNWPYALISRATCSTGPSSRSPSSSSSSRAAALLPDPTFFGPSAGNATEPSQVLPPSWAATPGASITRTTTPGCRLFGNCTLTVFVIGIGEFAVNTHTLLPSATSIPKARGKLSINMRFSSGPGAYGRCPKTAPCTAAPHAFACANAIVAATPPLLGF